MDFICLPIIFFTGLLMLSILTSIFSIRYGVPLILIFILIGLLVGSQPDNLLFMGFLNPRSVFFIGSVALALILFESGFNTSFSSFKSYAKPAVLLASLGVILSAVFLTPLILYLLPVSFIEAFLLSSIVGSTDAAAVFFLLRSHQLSLKPKIQATLEIESGSNDPMAIFLTFFCLTLLQQKTLSDVASPLYIINPFLIQFCLGILGGFSLFYLLKKAFMNIPLQPPLIPLFVLSGILLGFAVITLMGGSGYLALYLCGLYLGNAPLKSRPNLAKFLQTISWLCQILMFTLLGFYVKIKELPAVLGTAVLLATTLTFLARPAMIFLLLAFFKKYTLKDKLFISFVGLRGATSVLLALTPIVFDIPLGETFFNIIFIMVLFSLSIQGFFIPFVAKWCRTITTDFQTNTLKEEIDLPELNRSSLLFYKLSEKNPVLKKKNLPLWAQPLLLKRHHFIYQPNKMPQLQSGDQVYVFAPTAHRILLLDKIYSDTPSEKEPKIWGDIPIAPSTTLQELKYLYGVTVQNLPPHTSLEKLIQQNFPKADVGDRISIGQIDLIIRSRTDKKITGIGIDIIPNPKTKKLLAESAKEKLKRTALF